jgi:hypothetical protein
MLKVGLAAFIIALIIAIPALVIWSLNTLFPVLAIPVRPDTWFATLVLLWAIQANSTRSKE